MEILILQSKKQHANLSISTVSEQPKPQSSPQRAPYPGARHVELDGPDYHQDQQTAQGNLSQGALRVPANVFQDLWGKGVQGPFTRRTIKLTVNN